MAANFSVPSLILQAGRDKRVKAEGQNHFVEKAQNVLLLSTPFEKSKHEILMERDYIRDPALNAIREFFAQAAQ